MHWLKHITGPCPELMNALILMQHIKLPNQFTTLTILEHLWDKENYINYSLPSIQMVATALCGTEMKMLKDKNLQHQYYPIIMGHEGAGIVESVGEGVNTVKAGMNWYLELGNSSNLEPTSRIKSIP